MSSMNTNKKKLNYKKVFMWLFILIVVFTVGYLSVNIILNKDKKEYNNEKNIITDEDKYYIKVSYPNYSNKEFNDKISELIDEKISNFKSEIKQYEYIGNHKFELNINYEVYDNGKNLYSIHLVTEKYLQGANYNIEHYVFYYDYIKSKQVYIENILENKDEALKRLSKETDSILKNKYKDSIYDEELYNEGISPTLDNFSLLLFKENNLTLILKIYQVGPRSSGEIILDIDYKNLINVVSKEYKNKIIIDDEDKTNPDKRKIRDVSSFNKDKVVAFTFDDGPTPKITTKLLDELEKRDAKVTFFMLGNRAIQYKDLVKRAYLNGHTIGNHSYDHKNFLNLEQGAIINEINTTTDVIKSIIGETPRFIRPPYGNYNENILLMSNMTFILWNLDTEDWKSRNEEIVYNKIMNEAKAGNIILLHDLYDTSVSAAIKAIDQLLKDGYNIISLEEMERLNNVNYQINTVHNSLYK